MQGALHGCNCIMNVAGAFNALHTNPLGSCCVQFCLRRDPKDNNQKRDLCKQNPPALRIPATEGSCEKANYRWGFPT